MKQLTRIAVMAAIATCSTAAVALAATITGTQGPDTLVGTAHPDRINGLGGNDLILGLGGGDRIDGGAGNDTIDGDGRCPGPYNPYTPINPYYCETGNPGSD